MSVDGSLAAAPTQTAPDGETAVKKVSFDRDRLTWLSYLVLVCCGYIQGSLGPAASFLRAEWRFDYTMVSLHMSAFAAGMVVAGLCGRWLLRMVHRRGLLWIGGAGLAAGAIFLAFSRYPLQSLLVALLTGMLSCGAVAAVQATLSDHHGANRGTALTEANLGGSVGSIIAMSCLAIFTAAGMSWRVALVVPLLTIGVLGLAYGREPIAAHSGGLTCGIDRTIVPRRFWALWTTLLLAVGIEWSITFWAVPYLKDALGFSKTTATIATGGLFTAIVLGRVLGSQWIRLRRWDVDRLLRIALLMTLAGTLLLSRTSVPLALLGLIIAGLGIANLYPLTLALAMDAGSRHGDSTSARCTAAVGLALIVFPFTVGRLADAMDIRTALMRIVSILVVTAMVTREPRGWELLRRVDKASGDGRLGEQFREELRGCGNSLRRCLRPASIRRTRLLG